MAFCGLLKKAPSLRAIKTNRRERKKSAHYIEKNWVNPPTPSISPGMEPKGSTCITRRPDPDLRACK